MPRLHFLCAVLMFCSVIAGCGSSRPWTSVGERFGRAGADSDNLVLKPDQVSDGFKQAQKGLDNAEDTMLTFAQWKEDTGLYAEARRRYQEVLTNNTDCLPARLGIARIERKTGRFEQAREILTAAQEQYPEEANIPLEIGRMYSERENWPAATAAFEQAAEIAPNDETVRYELGVSLAQAARYEEAVAHLKYAVGDSAALYNVGYILHEAGRVEESVQWFEQALQAHPDERTQQLAGNMLEDIQSRTSSNRAAGMESATQVVSRRAARMPQVVADRRPARMPTQQSIAVTAHSRPVAPQMVNPSWKAAAVPVRVASQSGPYSTNGSGAGVATYSTDATGAPSQWRGPGQARQAPITTTNWTRTVDVAAPAAGPVEPPAWR